MLNTIMAVRNQERGENRQRIVKVFFTILFITGSASFFLFTLNSSAWSPFAGAQVQQAKKEAPLPVSNARGIVIARNTPVVDRKAASVTPTAKAPAKKVAAHPSQAHTAAVVGSQKVNALPQKVNALPQNVMTYSGKSDSGGRQQPIHPKAVQIKKGRHHSRHRSKVRVTMPSISHAPKTVPLAPPVPPLATSTTQPTTAPAATAEAITTTTPGDGTVVSNVPAIVTTRITSDVS